MAAHEEKHSARIDLTTPQTTPAADPEHTVRVEADDSLQHGHELEPRIAPRLSSNHNETLL